MQAIDGARRRLFQLLGAAGGLFALRSAQAHHTETHWEERSTHQVVYQCNKADDAYIRSILFSAGEMIRKYGDDVEVVIACFGPGIHLLGDPPERPVAKELQERASSLTAYGVSFHACGNTMDSLGWTEENLVEYAVVVPIGVDDIMQLQEKGFAYISW
jgi:intracellular sulfur oxidation DsrE/DsrF family protein